MRFFKYRIDEFNFNFFTFREWLSNNFWEWDWYYLFDFLEYIIRKDDELPNMFASACNDVFRKENVPYRFIGLEITPLTNDQEILEVKKALSSHFEPIRLHFEKSLHHMSDRRNPDYSNSIKESISAVECVCQIIVGRRGIALNRALKKLEDSGLEINNVLKKGFSQLYGWTSSDDGIRHAMMDLPTVDQDDARFILVTCSAFVNYLIAEASKAGIDLASNYENIILNA